MLHLSISTTILCLLQNIHIEPFSRMKEMILPLQINHELRFMI